MKKLLLLVLFVVACGSQVVAQPSGNPILAQVGGNITYSETKPKTKPGSVPTGTTFVDDGTVFIDAYVLMNIKADEHVAVFGASQEGRDIHECNQRLTAQIDAFTTELKSIGLRSEDIALDFIGHHPIYDFGLKGSVASEKASGFEVKENILVHYKEKEWLDKVLAAANKANIYDLIKVDYVINDINAVREKLLEEAAKIIKSKQAHYGNLFSLKFRTQTQVNAEKYDVVYPTDQYDSYTAFESGKVGVTDDTKLRVVESRKSKTFFFNARNAADFDSVINPVVSEPVVQFTLYLRTKQLIDR